MDRTLGKRFVPLQQNYLEFNVNSKYLTNDTPFLHRPAHMTEVDPVMFYRN
jgi:hypothetical protein